MATIPLNIRALLRAAEKQINEVDNAYKVALGGHDIPDEVTVGIKNLLENHRSALDYLAKAIREKHCPATAPRARVYFPILDSPETFSTRTKDWFPGLAEADPELWKYLEKIQPYPERGESELKNLRDLVNEFKHTKLVRQERIETPLDQKPLGLIFRKSDFTCRHDSDCRHENDTWIGFQFENVQGSALFILGRIHLRVEEVIEEVCALLET